MGATWPFNVFTIAPFLGSIQKRSPKVEAAYIMLGKQTDTISYE